MIRIREAQKHVHPVDPEYWIKVSRTDVKNLVRYLGREAGPLDWGRGRGTAWSWGRWARRCPPPGRSRGFFWRPAPRLPDCPSPPPGRPRRCPPPASGSTGGCSSQRPTRLKSENTYRNAMTFWYGSGSADPCLWLMDPDPAIFVIDLQDADRKLIFLKSFSACHF